jgi:hypothetical protein
MPIKNQSGDGGVLEETTVPTSIMMSLVCWGVCNPLRKPANHSAAASCLRHLVTTFIARGDFACRFCRLSDDAWVEELIAPDGLVSFSTVWGGDPAGNAMLQELRACWYADMELCRV